MIFEVRKLIPTAGTFFSKYNVLCSQQRNYAVILVSSFVIVALSLNNYLFMFDVYIVLKSSFNSCRLLASFTGLFLSEVWYRELPSDMMPTIKKPNAN